MGGEKENIAEVFNEIVVEIFPNGQKPQNQEYLRIPSMINTKKITPR